MANAYISVYKMLILHSSSVLLPKTQASQNWLAGSPPQGSRAFFSAHLQ